MPTSAQEEALYVRGGLGFPAQVEVRGVSSGYCARDRARWAFSLEGITILVQDSKNLYPYGIPFAFVSNIHHQYILVFRRHI